MADVSVSPVFYRIDVANVTRMTAPAYGTITYTERNSLHVLTGAGDLLLVGPMGVNYHIEGTDHNVLYLRRWDQPSVRSNSSVTVVQDPWGPHQIRTYKGPEAPPAPGYPARFRPRHRRHRSPTDYHP
jgi:hypothetical protein